MRINIPKSIEDGCPLVQIHFTENDRAGGPESLHEKRARTRFRIHKGKGTVDGDLVELEWRHVVWQGRRALHFGFRS